MQPKFLINTFNGEDWQENDTKPTILLSPENQHEFTIGMDLNITHRTTWKKKQKLALNFQLLHQAD
jgi:hypothetical protein